MGMDAQGAAIKQRQRPEGWTRLNVDSNPTTARGMKAVTFQTHVHARTQILKRSSSLLRHYTAFVASRTARRRGSVSTKLVMRIGMRDLCEFSATLECVRY